MGQTLRKLDLIALTASGDAANKLQSFLQNLREDTALALAGDTTIVHKAQSSKVAGADATADLASLITLTNEEKEAYTEHIESTGLSGSHLIADTTNTVSAPDASDHPTTVALLNELKTDLLAHDTQAGVHVNNDSISISASIPAGVLYDLLNEIKVDYEAHRILTTGTVHGAADSTNVVTAANATTLATALLLANDLKTQYEAHRVLTAASVHGAADSTDVVTAPDATDLASVLILANDLRTQYEAHRVLTAASVHGAVDSTNTVTEAETAELADMATLANEWKLDFNTHNLKAMASAVVE